ncbi:MAG: LysR family transcriptional regulator [Ruminococcus sp.]|nr:LysR family transcriptional regulator [Ruminococcus sp.]
MNLLHIKYAVEVARTGSINRAAEKLVIGQPNLSRAIKELESTLNIKIFERSARGMTLTAEGETFMLYAGNILEQVENLEGTFRKGAPSKKRFSISVPHAHYIANAFANFSAALADEPDIEFFYRETSSYPAITGVTQENYKLAIIRYADVYEKHFQAMFDEKNLKASDIARFRRVMIISRKNPLAKKSKITLKELEGYTEIAYADPYVPQLQQSEVRKGELTLDSHKRIFINQRASLCSLLNNNPCTFIMDSPDAASELEKYGLIMKELENEERIYKDVLICRKEYSFSKLDNMFLVELYKSRDKSFKNPVSSERSVDEQ